MVKTDFTSFFESLPLGAYRLTMDASVLQINMAFAKMHGYSSRDAFLATVGSGPFNPYADAAQLAQFRATLLQRGEVRNMTARCIRHHSGEPLWVRENAHLVRDAQDVPIYYEGTVEDISMEHFAINELQRQDFILRSLVQAIPDQLWLKDLYGNYIICNQHYADAMHLPIEQIVGTVDADHPEAAMAAHYVVADETVLRQGKPVRYQVDVRTAASEHYNTFEIVKAPLCAASGSVVGILGMARDVSDRNAIAPEWRIPTSTLQNRSGPWPDMLFEMTAQGVFRAIHCPDSTPLAMSHNLLINKSAADILPTDAATVCRMALSEATASGRSSGRQYRLDIAGETHWFELSVLRKSTAPEEETRLMVMVRDITRDKT